LAINTSLVAFLISNLLNQGFRSIWKQNVGWTVQNYLIMVPLGVILAVAYQNYGYTGVLLFFGPLLMARYSFKLYMDLKRSYLETVEALSRALEAKDPVTSGHAERVGEYAVAIAEELKLSESRIDKIRYAALLHDIGKIGIADGVLNKEGMLSTEEFAQIREHPVIGSEILKDIDFLREASKIIRHHHERYDGRGYPDGLKGDEVPIEAYILAVADAFDAMTNDRPYRKALPVDKARSIIAEEAGRQFHPKVADALIKTLDKGLFNVAY
ncbi:MAG: HD-GYP domain-containing protein, partial [Bacillota bacterium]|nr:HD-GYP domain-containing protein [Bacillota bacterium]